MLTNIERRESLGLVKAGSEKSAFSDTFVTEDNEFQSFNVFHRIDFDALKNASG